MSTTVPEEIVDDLPPVTAEPPAEEWRLNKAGKEYVPRKDGRAGVIIRQDDETIEQARERDSTARDAPPKRKPKRPKMPPAPRKADLKQLEHDLADALRAPGAIAMTFGDEWAFEHFNRSGPFLARQLVQASEYNPWLRRHLEAAATGEEAMMKIAGIAGIAGGLIAYAVPPVIYFGNLRVPEKARIMWGIPPRKENTPAYAAATPPPFANGSEPPAGP